MKLFVHLTLVATMLSAVPCVKAIDEPNPCGSNAIVRRIESKNGRIDSNAHGFFIVEEGTIDKRLLPCVLLEPRFKVQNLEILFSGLTYHPDSLSTRPCCEEKIFLTELRAR